MIEPRVLPKEIREHGHRPGAIISSPTIGSDFDFNQSVQRFEKQLIESALKESDGIQKQAAEKLGLKPTTLNEKIKRLGIVT